MGNTKNNLKSIGGSSQTLEQVLTTGNESTTQDAIFRLDADKYLKINRTDQSIEIWDETIDAVSPLSKWRLESINFIDGVNNSNISALSFSITDGDFTSTIDPDEITVSGSGEFSKLNPFGLDIDNGTDALTVIADKITLNGIDYPLPTGATSQIATLADITGATGSFLSADAKTVTVVNGLITSIV